MHSSGPFLCILVDQPFLCILVDHFVDLSLSGGVLHNPENPPPLATALPSYHFDLSHAEAEEHVTIWGGPKIKWATWDCG